MPSIREKGQEINSEIKFKLIDYNINVQQRPSINLNVYAWKVNGINKYIRKHMPYGT